jgi:hypothetical protein
VIDHLDYWERAINTGEYWRDGLRDVTPAMLMNTISYARNAAGYYSTIERPRRVPEGPADNRGRYMPRRLLTRITPIFIPPIRGEPKK